MAAEVAGSNPVRHPYTMSHTEKLSSAVREYSHQIIDREEFISKLIMLEGKYWHFALDNDHLLLRNEFTKVVINIDTKSGSFSLSRVTLSSQREKKQNSFSSPKKIIGVLGAARRLEDPKGAKQQLDTFFSSLDPAEVLLFVGAYHNRDGIPNIALNLAKEKGIEVVVVAPRIILLPEFIETLSGEETLITRGQEWGDETEFLIGASSEVYVVGNYGYWTMLEILTAERMGKKITFLNSQDKQ